jgi:small subunit ribosomal protein S3
MGRKVHPIGFRLKVIRDWDGRWYAAPGQFADTLHEDIKIRKFITKDAEKAGISRVEVERNSTLITVTIHTARPGIVIGQKGQAVKEMRLQLEKLTGKKVKVEVSEIDKPDLDPKLVAESIAGQLERRIGHSRAIKRAISQAMRQGAQGVKILVSGRLGGSDMARREGAFEGRIPRSTLRANLDYGTAEALTTFGRIGIKVWIYKGEVLQQEDKKPGEKQDVYVSQ